MSTNIRVQRICEYCGEEFIAKTTRTRYCSHTCNSRAYKAAKRSEKVESSNLETFIIKTQPLDELKAKPYLTTKQAAELLGCSVRTVYRLIDSNTIRATNLGERLTRIKAEEINKLMSNGN